MSLNFIKSFSDNINELTPDIVGGKAFALAALYQKGFPVPDGFIITVQAFDYFFKSCFGATGKSVLSQIAEKGVYLSAGMVEVRKKIEASEIPLELSQAIYNSLVSLNAVSVAVRSSATLEDAKRYSYAGQFESFLGVTKEDLLSKVKLCWNSLFSQRALVYSQGGGKIGKMAVIIQKMVAADISGVCFSIDPVNYDTNAIIVELVAGQGDSLVQGVVVPDRYIVCKDTLIIKEKHANIGVIIEDNILKDLAQLVVKIEKFYNKPMDVEWALKNGRLHLLQARPITAFSGQRRP